MEKIARNQAHDLDSQPFPQPVTQYKLLPMQGHIFRMLHKKRICEPASRIRQFM